MFIKIAENEWVNMDNIGRISKKVAEDTIEWICLFDTQDEFYCSYKRNSPKAQTILKWLETLNAKM